MHLMRVFFRRNIIMFGLLRKRSREYEASPYSPKRFHGETEQQIFHLLEDGDSADKILEDEECVASEEMVSGYMRSLEEEIGLTWSTSSRGSPGLSRDDSLASDMTKRYGTSEADIDVGYLLGASDGVLGIPPSPLLNSDGQLASSLKEEGSYLNFAENAEHKGFVDNWHFEDDFMDLKQFAVFEDVAATDWDIVSQGAFIEGDYSSPWRTATAGGIY